MREGYEGLWAWFGCSRASWLTIPRVLMHEMPDEWQLKMAQLLNEWDETFDASEMPDPYVAAKKNGKYTRWPRWIVNYKRPNKEEIKKLMVGDL